MEMSMAEKQFDRYYERGGKGLADDVWNRIIRRIPPSEREVRIVLDASVSSSAARGGEEGT